MCIIGRVITKVVRFTLLVIRFFIFSYTLHFICDYILLTPFWHYFSHIFYISSLLRIGINTLNIYAINRINQSFTILIDRLDFDTLLLFLFKLLYLLIPIVYLLHWDPLYFLFASTLFCLQNKNWRSSLLSYFLLSTTFSQNYI